jgi:hypothetical protein
MSKDERVTIELVRGNSCGEGLYLNDNRIAGTKPMPAGKVVNTWSVSVAELRELLTQAMRAA